MPDGRMIGAFFAPAGARLFAGLALVFAIICGLQTWRLDRAYQTIADFRAAQPAATAAQIAANHEPARVSAEIARQSDADAPSYYRAVADAAGAHRLPVRACSPSAADLPGTDRPSAIDDGPAPAPDMVSRPRAEDDQIVAAAGRAAQMHADAQALIAAGVAIPSPAEPETPQ